jgi:phosphoglycerol transferase MdoB-like AlkP superfamily enzyme
MKLRLNSMKEKIPGFLEKFAAITLACIPVILLVRLWEYFSLGAVTELPKGGFWLEMLGVLWDIPAFLMVCLVLLVPYILIALYRRSLATGFFIVIITLLFLFHLAVVKYFIITLTPLDQVVFSYNFKELVMISQSSVSMGFSTFLPFILLIISILLFQYLFRRLQPGKLFLRIFYGIMIISPFIMLFLVPGANRYQTDFNYYMATNKTRFFTFNCLKYIRHSNGLKGAGAGQLSIPGNESDILAYQQDNPGFSFFGTTFPLLHEENTRDVLGGNFSFSGQKPNLVFIIIESMSPSFFNVNPAYGNFMPFLDSLSSHSLYWTNCLGTSDRTFNVLPALFGSMPWSNGAFLNPAFEPLFHKSMIKYLHSNGYKASFFYGGDPDFNNMRYFIKREQGDYILNFFGKGYSPMFLNQTGYSWGYPDKDVFKRSFEVIDSMDHNPRLDIYLTLSMHAPFTVPDQETYLKQLDERIRKLNLTEDQKREVEKHRDIFSTILYTDDALREFFRNYSKRKDYANTIFFITGDHSMPELNPGIISAIENFHVPFMIYSPILKESHKYNAVITHLDVTPTVLAMLKNNCGIATAPVSHWMGSEMDTSSSFRCTKTLAFILNNKEMVDYVKGTEYILRDRYFRILPGLRLNMIGDRGRTEALKEELAVYMRVTNAAAAANRLLPAQYYYGKELKHEFLAIDDDVVYNGNQSNGEFYGLLNKMKFGKDFRYLDLDFSFTIQTNEKNPEFLPRIVLEIYDENQKMIDWRQINSIRDEYRPGEAGRPITISVSQEIDLTYLGNLENKSIKMYLWNPKKVNIGYDRLTRLITGYY